MILPLILSITQRTNSSMENGSCWLLRIVLPALLMSSAVRCQDKLKSIYSWKALEFAFPNENAREAAISQGIFRPGAPIPIDVDFYYGAKQGSNVFITIPRFQDGIPATLGYVTDSVSADGNPIIAPYPNWDWHKTGDCNLITSVYRIQVDECGRLWVLDTGKLGDTTVCPPQLHVFSLQNNKLLAQYKFPRDHYKEDSLYVSVAIDVRSNVDKCRDTFAYIADVTGFMLIVYDHRNSRSWKITNNLFYPYPPHGTFHIRGDTFDLMDGILGLALGPVSADGDRILYFHSLASTVESWVSTSVIRNYSLFHNIPDAAARSFKPFYKERSSQSAAEAMNKDGILFFGLLSDLAIACWNSIRHSEYDTKNIEKVVINPDTLQFPSGLKLVTPKSGREEMWVITSSFQRFMTGTMRENETNFRIQAGFVDELVRGTKCDVPSRDTRFHVPLQFPK